jgi:hypothetical protein
MGIISACRGPGIEFRNVPLNNVSDDIDIAVMTPLPETPDYICSYRIIKPDITCQYVTEYGAKFGIVGEPSNTNFGQMTMSNPEKDKILHVYSETGALEYNCPNKLFKVNPELPSDNEAIDIATNFLRGIGFLFLDIDVENVVIGGSTNGIPSHLLVKFTRTIDGFPITGPGSKFGIRIGDEGEIVRVLVWHPEFEQAGEINIIEPYTAVNSLQTKKAYPAAPPDCKSIKIEDISLGYYLSSIDTYQQYLTPAYIFRGKCYNGKGEYLQDYVSWVDAGTYP